MALNFCTNFFRELRRSAVKSWISDQEEEEDELKPEMKKRIFTAQERQLLSRSNLKFSEVDVFKHVKRFGVEFKSGEEQVVVHGRNNVANFGEIAFVIRNKTNQKLALLLHELKVDPVPHLGLYRCSRSGPTTLIKFKDLISSTPLNMYTSVDHLKKEFCYVSLKESLIFAQ
jgi:hypothetical protein